MRVHHRRRQATAIPVLALLLAAALVAPAQAVDEPDLSSPYAIATSGTEPMSMAPSADGKYLFVANAKSSAITVISTATNAEIKSIPLAEKGNGVTVANDGTVWATQRVAGEVAKISSPLSPSPSIAYFSVGTSGQGRPTSVALSLDNALVYVSAKTGSSSQVTALNTSTGAVVHESALTTNAASTVSIAPNGSVWLAGDNPLIFTTDLASSQPIPGTSSWAGQAVFSPDGSTAYVGIANAIKVIGLPSLAVNHTIASPKSTAVPARDLFSTVSWLDLSADGKTLYAVTFDFPWMGVIDLAGAIAGTPGSIVEIAGDEYLNSVVAIGNAFYVAMDGAAYDGTTVMRYPVAPKVNAPTATATPGGMLTLSGSALVGASVKIGGVQTTTTGSGYNGVTVKVPNLSALASLADVPVTVTTNSGSVSSQVDIALIAATPRISGSPRVGSTLVAVPGTWSLGYALSYQWLASGRAISGATRSSFTATASQAGKNITVRVIGRYGTLGTTTKTSAATSKVALGTLKAATPKTSGTARVGRTLTAKPGTWTSGTKFTYQWYAGSKVIKGAKKSKYKIAKKYKGKTIKVKVTGAKSDYAKVSKTSKPTKKVK